MGAFHAEVVQQGGLVLDRGVGADGDRRAPEAARVIADDPVAPGESGPLVVPHARV